MFPFRSCEFPSAPEYTICNVWSGGMHDLFNRMAKKVSLYVGSPWAFAIALLTIIVWAICGPIFKFSDTWQLVINTSTTIVTFLMVFVIQSSQNRDSQAIHLKLDELIRSIDKARNELIDLENVKDDELKKLQADFEQMHKEGHAGTGNALKAIGSEVKKRKKN